MKNKTCIKLKSNIVLKSNYDVNVSLPPDLLKKEYKDVRNYKNLPKSTIKQLEKNTFYAKEIRDVE